MRYLPHTPDEIQQMLARIGVKSIDELFAPIPEGSRLGLALDLEPALDEPTLMRHLTELAAKNPAASMLSFLGAGMYDHHVPPAVDQLLMRSEFYTAYTPYQAEVSQGTLQATFEFQTLVCQILGMEVANASMYDGASGLAEAVLMARRVTGRETIALSEALHPEYIETVLAYLRGTDGPKPKVVMIPVDESGLTSLASAKAAMNSDIAAVVVGYPNFFGCVEPLAEFRELSAAHGSLLVTSTLDAYAFGVLAPPGQFGVDIATAEGQSLAVPPQFGGPGVGLFTCRKTHLRQMPGRLVGETVDSAGERGFVLTLSTREQHIRRERATSNICTNHGLIALSFAMRVAMLGESGLRHASELCLRNAEHVKKALLATGRYELPYQSSKTFNEFLVRAKSGTALELAERALAAGVLVGVPLSKYFPDRPRDLLIAVTEKHTAQDLDNLLRVL